jgi:hypothetical protein
MSRIPHCFGTCAGLLLAIALLAGCESGAHLLFGFMDAQGLWAVAPEYDDAAPFTEGLAAVRRGEKWGYVDTAGRVVVEPRFDEAWPFSEGLAAVATDEQWSFIDTRGQTIIAGPFAQADQFFAGVAAVQVDGKWGFVDHAGTYVIEPQFDDLHEYAGEELAWFRRPCFSENLCAAKLGELWGYVDRRGEWVIPPRFDEARNFAEGLAAACEPAVEGSCSFGYIDRRGEWQITPRFMAGMSFSGGRAVVAVGRPAETAAAGMGDEQDEDAEPVVTAVLIDTTGRAVAELGWQPLGDNLSTAMELLQGFAPDYLADGLAPASRGTRWGFMDRDGHWVIEPQFHLVLPFRDGRAAVGLNDDPAVDALEVERWGVIDQQGRWLVEPRLSSLGPLGDALLPARLHARWGLLDRDGHWQVPPIHAEERDFIDLPVFRMPAGEGLYRMGVYANHRWKSADPRGRTTGIREYQWLESIYDTSDGGAPQLLAYMRENLWGLADTRLNPLTEARFDAVPKRVGRFVEVRIEGKLGCVDTAGRWVVPAEFSDIATCERNRAIARRGTEWGLWTRATGWRADEQYSPDADDTPTWNPEDIGFGGSTIWRRRDGRYELEVDGQRLTGVPPVDQVRRKERLPRVPGRNELLSAVRRAERWGVIDERGREILPVRYKAVGGNFGGLFAVQVDGGWAIVDSRDREVFPAGPEQIAPFNRRVASYCQGSRCGLIDRRGEVVLAPRYAAIEPLSDRYAVVTAGEDDPAPGGKGIIDSAGRLRVEPVYESIAEFSASLWLARHHERGALLLSKASGAALAGLPKIAYVMALSEGLALAKFEVGTGESRYGYLDGAGRLVIPPHYDRNDETQSFQNGVAVVWIAGKCGAIDRRGRQVLPIEHDHCFRLQDGRLIAGVEAGAPQR